MKNKIFLTMVFLSIFLGAAVADDTGGEESMPIVYPNGITMFTVGHPVYPEDMGDKQTLWNKTTELVTNLLDPLLPTSTPPRAVDYVTIINITSPVEATDTVVKMNIPPWKPTGTSYLNKSQMDLYYLDNGTQISFWIDSVNGNIHNNNTSIFIYAKMNLSAGTTSILLFRNNTSQPGVNDGSEIFLYKATNTEIETTGVVSYYSGQFNTLEFSSLNTLLPENYNLSVENQNVYSMNFRSYAIYQNGTNTTRQIRATMPIASSGSEPLFLFDRLASIYHRPSISVATYKNSSNTVVFGSGSGNVAKNMTWHLTQNISLYPKSENDINFTTELRNNNVVATANMTFDKNHVNMFSDISSPNKTTVYPNGTISFLYIYNSTYNVTYSITNGYISPVQSITVNGYEIIETGSHYYYYATVSPTYAPQAVIWSVNNTSVATIDPSTGLLTPVSSGTVLVSATASDDTGVVGTMAVTVKQRYDVMTMSSSGGNISTSVPAAIAGTPVTITATPDSDYYLSHLIVTTANGTTISVVNNTFVMPSENVTVLATFMRISHSVTVSQTVGGTLSASPTLATYGTTITISAMPSPGYHPSRYVVLASGGGTVTTSGNQFSMPADDVIVSAQFDPLNYSVSVLPSAGGSAYTSANVAAYGEIVTIFSQPEDGYAATGYAVTTDGGAIIETVDGSFIMPADNVSIIVTFNRAIFDVIVLQTSGGTLSASSNIAAPNQTITLTGAPDSGYILSSYIVTSSDGSPITITDNKFQMPSDNVTAMAQFSVSTPTATFTTINGTDVNKGKTTVSFTSDSLTPSYRFLWETSMDNFTSIFQTGYTQNASGSFEIDVPVTGDVQVRIAAPQTANWSYLTLTVTDRLSRFDDLMFTEIFDSYFSSGNFGGWQMLDMSRDYYYTTVTPFIFWAVVFGIIYTALYLTTGGAFIPAAVYSAVGSILVNVLPLELSVWARILISVGLFVVPVYKYFKQ